MSELNFNVEVADRYLAALRERPIGATKGLLGASQLTAAQLVAAGVRLGDPRLSTPLAVLRASALRHNVDLLQRWVAERGAVLAPHVKTTMSPEVVRLQLDAGAWGVTVANCVQAQVMVDLGVGRILVANEIVDPGDLAWLTATLSAPGGPELLCYADSETGVQLLAAAAPDDGAALGVLVEAGAPGGRGGVRSLEQAAVVASAVAQRRGLLLRGAAGFEGILGHDRSLTSLDRVRDFCLFLRSTAEVVGRAVDRQAGAQLIISAGGSVFFDEVASCLAPELADRVTPLVVLRSGGYVSHDHGHLGHISPLQGGPEPFQAALEVYGRVLSIPEPGLGLVNVGKRDVGSDIALPEVVRIAGPDGSSPRPAPDLSVRQLNDQHAYIHRRDGGPIDDVLSVGAIVVLGIAHPCTTFDRWSIIPIIDDDDRVVDVAHTFF